MTKKLDRFNEPKPKRYLVRLEGKVIGSVVDLTRDPTREGDDANWCAYVRISDYECDGYESREEAEREVLIEHNEHLRYKLRQVDALLKVLKPHMTEKQKKRYGLLKHK